MLRELFYWAGYVGTTAVLVLCRAASPDFNTWCAVEAKRIQIKNTFRKGGVKVD